MKALILAAGKGMRLGHLTEKIPKPMVPISGKPVLEYLILLCKKHGINDIAINTSHMSKKIIDYFGEGEKWNVNINYSYEEKLLGTSGALNNFKDFLNEEPFFVIYGDNITNLNLTEMMKFHKKNRAFSTIYLYHEDMADDKTTPGWVILDEENNVKEIIENPNQEQKIKIKKIPLNYRFTNSGIYIFDPTVLGMIPQGFSDFSKDIFPKILSDNKKIAAYKGRCYIREIGQMHRYEKSKEEIESGKVIILE